MIDQSIIDGLIRFFRLLIALIDKQLLMDWIADKWLTL